MTLDEMLQQSPNIPGYGGGQWAMYSIACCWWTSFPQDLGVNRAQLPCCPHCGSVLMQAPLRKFVEAAQTNPAHYGAGQLATFVAAHSRNSATCHPRWQDYPNN
jgi:hypothetical protein